LTDFGLAQLSDTRYETVEDVHLYGVAGTLGYWAPEMVVATSKTGYGWEVDVWALGMVIYEMALNKLVPFYAAKTLTEVKRHMMIEDVPVDEVGDPELADLLSLVSSLTRWFQLIHLQKSMYTDAYA
jgi:serine/threonine protein kinase